MTTAKDLLLTDLDYCAWADQVTLDACSRLSTEEIERDLRASFRSAIGTLRHMYDAELVWTTWLRANALPSMEQLRRPKVYDPPPGPGLVELQRDWPEVWRRSREWLENLPDADVGGTLSFITADGNELRVSRWKILRHMLNHSTLHRGQVIGMLRAMGKQPPSTDLFTYYFR